MRWKNSKRSRLLSLYQQNTSIFLKRWKAPILTALSLSAFLTSVLLINIHVKTYKTSTTSQRLWTSCDGSEICSDSKTQRLTNNEGGALGAISLWTLYNEMVKTGIGRKIGNKMNISLVSAFEHAEQIYVFITSEERFGDTMYCRYFDHRQKEISPALKGVVYPEYTANCARREGTKYISLAELADGPYEFPMPIIDRTKSVTSHYFSACLAPLYGTEPKWLLLAEFVEHHKIQGVTHFYIYVKDIDEYSRKLLDDYVRTGDAEIITLHDRFVRKGGRWQYPQLQECLIRARGHSQWVALIDLDERLTTTEYNGTLLDFLQNISDPRIAEVSIQQRWILRNETTPEKYIDKDQVAEFMPTLRYHNTSHVAPPGHTAKYIVDPKKAMVANIHDIDLFFDNFTRQYMKPEEAVIRHYRDIHAENWEKLWLKGVEDIGEFSMTDYPEAHTKTLRENVQRRLHHVYGGMH